MSGALTDGSAGGSIRVGAEIVHGLPIDGQTRCVHFSDAHDIVAIRFACCRRFHPCHACHEAVADHPAEVWAVERFAEHAILCGACGSTSTIARYLDADRCPACDAAFNPGCRTHRHLYFAASPASA